MTFSIYSSAYEKISLKVKSSVPSGQKSRVILCTKKGCPPFKVMFSFNSKSKPGILTERRTHARSSQYSTLRTHHIRPLPALSLDWGIQFVLNAWTVKLQQLNKKRFLQLMFITHVPDECEVLRVFVRDVRGQGPVNWAAWAGPRDLSCVNISLKPSPPPAIRPSQTSEKSRTHREEDCHVSREILCVHGNALVPRNGMTLCTVLTLSHVKRMWPIWTI